MKINIKTIFVIAYCFVLIFLYADSTFLNEKYKMVYQRFVPENKVIGYDFTICYRFAEKLFVQKQILSINSPNQKSRVHCRISTSILLSVISIVRFWFERLPGISHPISSHPRIVFLSWFTTAPVD